MVQDITKSTYDTIVLWNPTKIINNDNLPIKNSQKYSDPKFEDSHPYMAELVEIMPKYRISGKNYSQFMLGVGFLLCKKMEKWIK